MRAAGSPEAAPQPLWWEEQYVRGRLLLDMIVAVAGDDRCPPASLLLPGNFGSRQSHAKETASTARLVRQLEVEHLEGQRVDYGALGCTKGFADLLRAEMDKLCGQLASKLANWRHTERQIKKVSQRPTEQRRFMARKKKQRADIVTLLGQMQAWAQWCQGSPQRPALASALPRDLELLLEHIRGATVADVLAGASPWVPESLGVAEHIAQQIWEGRQNAERRREELIHSHPWGAGSSPGKPAA